MQKAAQEEMFGHAPLGDGACAPGSESVITVALVFHQHGDGSLIEGWGLFSPLVWVDSVFAIKLFLI